MRARIAAALVAGMVTFGTAPAEAQKVPEKIKLKATSRDGAVLIRVPVQPFDYALDFSKDGKSGFLSRVYLMPVRFGGPGFRYIARTLPPGRYRLNSVWQQGLWSACLEQGTIEFTIKAGEIAYVGTLQTDPILQWIQRRAIERGRTEVTGGDIVVQRPEGLRPAVDHRDDAGLDEARRFAETSMNQSGALVRLAELNETQFATSGGNRAIEICG